MKHKKKHYLISDLISLIVGLNNCVNFSNIAVVMYVIIAIQWNANGLAKKMTEDWIIIADKVKLTFACLVDEIYLFWSVKIVSALSNVSPTIASTLFCDTRTSDVSVLIEISIISACFFLIHSYTSHLNYILFAHSPKRPRNWHTNSTNFERMSYFALFVYYIVWDNHALLSILLSTHCEMG